MRRIFAFVFVVVTLSPVAVVYASQSASQNPQLEQPAAPAANKDALPANDSDRWAKWGVYINGFLAMATFVLAVYAVKQAKAAELNAEALIKSERAWVLGDNIGKLPEIPTDTSRVEILWIRIPIKNFGKTVARIRRTCRQRVLIPSGQKLPDAPDYKDILESDDLLPPDSTVALDIGTVASDFFAVRNDNSRFYLYGFVDYVDLGEKDRQTRFCYVYHIPTGFNPVPEGFYPCANCPKSYTECT